MTVSEETFEHWMQRGEDRDSAFKWIMEEEDLELRQIRFDKFTVLLEEECFDKTFSFIQDCIMILKPKPDATGPEVMVDMGSIIKELKDEELKNA